MEFRDKILESYNVNLPIKGGNGTCIERPIIIDETQKYNYVSLEKTCINYACLINGQIWQMEKQELIDYKGKWIDVLKIKLSVIADFDNYNKQMSFFFDISDCIKHSETIADVYSKWI